MPRTSFMLRASRWVCTALVVASTLVCTLKAADGREVGELLGRFETFDLAPGGRLDAVCDLGGGAVIAGSRRPHSGMLFLSEDWGRTWNQIPTPTDIGITCIAASNRKTIYLLNEAAEVFRTHDGGQSWRKLTKLLQENRNTQGGAAAYGIHVTKRGTLLVTDTTTTGGHVYRSTDAGETWADLGVVARNALYRFVAVANGLLINDWSGWVYKSVDDGLTWLPMPRLAESPLFATESLGFGHALQADQAGHVYHSSNTGETWRRVATLDGSADDFVSLGYGAALYSTYTSERNVYASLDFGRTWSRLAGVPLVDAEDCMDHVIKLDHPESVVVIAGTVKGRLLRAEIPRRKLIESVDAASGQSTAGSAREFDVAWRADTTNFEELNEPEDVLIHRGHAYVPCREGGNVAIYDLSGIEPSLVHSIRHESIADVFGVAAEENHLFVVSMTNAVLSCFDVSRPANPVKVSAVPIGGSGSWLGPIGSNYTRLRKVAVQGGIAFVTHASEGKLYIIDVSKPAMPQVMSSFHTGDGAFAVLPRGDTLYLAGYAPGSSVIAVDISDRRRPRIVDSHRDPKNLAGTCALALQGNVLAVVAYNAGSVSFFDVSDPRKLRLLGRAVDSKTLRGPGRVVLDGRFAYVIDSSTHRLATIDISDPSQPRIVHSVGDALRLRMPYGIAIDGDRVIVAGRQSRNLVVFDRTRLAP